MSILHPKLIVAVAAVVVIFLLVSLAQEMNRRLHIQREVQRLEQEVQAMRKNVIELENLNQYFRTDDYQERLAREKLNYQAPGEKVVLIPQQPGGSVQGTTTNANEPPDTTPIFERWWRTFFVDGTVLPS